MKSITFWSRIAAVGLLFGALAACILAFTLTRSAIGSPGDPIIPAPLGVIETDGSLDSTFDAGTFTNGLVLASAYQSDGKLLIAGQFTQVHGVSRAGIARLNTDGTLDTSFDPGTGSDLGVGGVLVQPDGNILIWKFFHTFNGDSGLASLVRLKSNGSTDPFFSVGHNLGGTTGFNLTEVFSVILQADGKIVVAGQFSFVFTPTGNVNRSRVARFNIDGTLDPTFDPGAGAVSSQGEENTFVFYAASQGMGADAGKIIIQGSFDLFDNHPVESFLPGCKDKVYERFHQKGRMLPEGLAYVNSWLENDGVRCFQLMETDDPSLFQVWLNEWKDLVAMEIVELGEKPRA